MARAQKAEANAARAAVEYIPTTPPLLPRSITPELTRPEFEPPPPTTPHPDDAPGDLEFRIAQAADWQAQ